MSIFTFRLVGLFRSRQIDSWMRSILPHMTSTIMRAIFHCVHFSHSITVSELIPETQLAVILIENNLD